MTFTYKQVKELLCPHCKADAERAAPKISNRFLFHTGQWRHKLPTGIVKCKASRWSNKAAHLENASRHVTHVDTPNRCGMCGAQDSELLKFPTCQEYQNRNENPTPN